MEMQSKNINCHIHNNYHSVICHLHYMSGNVYF